jgi:hypothetical protein
MQCGFGEVRPRHEGRLRFRRLDIAEDHDRNHRGVSDPQPFEPAELEALRIDHRHWVGSHPAGRARATLIGSRNEPPR